MNTSGFGLQRERRESKRVFLTLAKKEEEPDNLDEVPDAQFTHHHKFRSYISKTFVVVIH